MRKQYRIENLDCAHCAMKMEEEAKKVPGVLFLSVNFVSMKLTLEAEESAFDSVFRKVEKACREVESDVRFAEQKYRMSKNQKNERILILLSALLFVAAKLASEWICEPFPFFHTLLFLPAFLLAGFDVIKKAVKGIFHKKFLDENFLMTLASFGAMAIGEASEGVMVILLYRIGEFFQALAVAKSRNNIAELMDIRPDVAYKTENGQILAVKPEEVPIGSMLLVRAGEKIPIDGVITEGNSFLDTSALTGESVPKEVLEGDEVISGCINLNGVLKIKTTKDFETSTVSQILNLIEESSAKKSKAERFITRFARYYTPIVVSLAAILAFFPPLFGADFSLWIHKAITCLVISCPCALVISVPLTFFGGIGCAGKHGILIKGAEALEKLKNAEVCIFDKTGTLTKGIFKVTAIHPELIREEELLELAATCEHFSNHPISLSLKAAYNKDVDKKRIGRIEETAGQGVTAEIDGKTYFVGGEALMNSHNIPLKQCEKCNHEGTVVHIAAEGEYLGHIVIADELREDAKSTVDSLKALGLRRLLLFSGDRTEVAKSAATKLSLDGVWGNLLPQDKLNLLQKETKEKSEKGNVLFVGDGINDAPVLAAADLGIAMGGIGADAAIEAADVVLMDDNPSKIPLSVRIAKKTFGILWQNVILSIGIKLFVLIPNIFLGEESVPLALAIFADVGVCLIAILNATRALHIKK